MQRHRERHTHTQKGRETERKKIQSTPFTVDIRDLGDGGTITRIRWRGHKTLMLAGPD